MQALRRYSKYWTKPPIGCEVNWDHPLAKNLIACFLLNENASITVFDIVNHIALSGNNVTWKGGTTLNAIGSTFKVATPHHLKVSFPITVVWQGFLSSSYSQLNNYGFYLGCSYSDSTVTPSIAYGIKIANSFSSPATFCAGTNDTSVDRTTSAHLLNVIQVSANNRSYASTAYGSQIVGRFGNPNGNSIELLLNGNLIDSVNPILSSAPAYGTDSTFGFGSIISAGSVKVNSTNLFGLIYNTALSDFNCHWLSEEPYCYISVPMSRRYFFLPNSGESFGITIGTRPVDFNSGING